MLRGALADDRFDAQLLVCGQHLVANTPLPEEIAGLPAMRLASSPDAVDWISQKALSGALRDRRTDVAFLVGDRFELLSVAECCTLSGVSIAHCSGGDRTFGAFDDQVRDAITKLAHLHFVAHDLGAKRIASLQEEPWRIAVTGDPGLDTISRETQLTPQDLEGLLGVRPAKTDIVVAIHPVTRSTEETASCLRVVSRFCEDFEGHVFLSAPNGDPGSDVISTTWLELSSRMPRCQCFSSLGGKAFRSLVAACGVLVGNSSAGVWEAPSLGTPSLDLGSRQSGRIRGNTVWASGADGVDDVAGKLRHLLSPEVQTACRNGVNPYGDGNATPRILEHIARHMRDPRLMLKS